MKSNKRHSETIHGEQLKKLQKILQLNYSYEKQKFALYINKTKPFKFSTKLHFRYLGPKSFTLTVSNLRVPTLLAAIKYYDWGLFF